MALEDPFAVLGVDDTAGDDDIKCRYLALVRLFPPEQAPERFQRIRAAYETIRGERERLRFALVQPNQTGYNLLIRDMLVGEEDRGQGLARVSRATVTALVREGLAQAAAQIIAKSRSPATTPSE